MSKPGLAGWAAISEIIAAIAVVVSLFFVAFSIKQNTEALEAATWERFLDRTERANQVLVDNPDLARIVRIGESDPDALDDDDRIRFTHYARMRFGAWESVYHHYDVGRIDTAKWRLWNEFYKHRLDSAGYRRAWAEVQNGYDPEFRAILAREYHSP